MYMKQEYARAVQYDTFLNMYNEKHVFNMYNFWAQFLQCSVAQIAG